MYPTRPQLTLADYDRLGVVDVNERKKLFYLVQRYVEGAKQLLATLLVLKLL